MTFKLVFPLRGGIISLYTICHSIQMCAAKYEHYERLLDTSSVYYGIVDKTSRN